MENSLREQKGGGRSQFATAANCEVDRTALHYTALSWTEPHSLYFNSDTTDVRRIHSDCSDVTEKEAEVFS